MGNNILFFTLLCAISILLYHIVLYFTTRVPMIITPRGYIKDLVKDLQNSKLVNSKSIIYELGSAWGNFSFSVQKLQPSKIVGYELSPVHFIYSYLKAKFKRSAVQFKMQDFFKADISDADIIYVYLMPKIVAKLWQKIKTECKPGTIMILLGHDIKGGQLIKKLKTDSQKINSTFYYFYRV